MDELTPTDAMVVLLTYNSLPNPTKAMKLLKQMAREVITSRGETLLQKLQETLDKARN